jgi:thiamine biosynthesis protein ThiS
MALTLWLNGQQRKLVGVEHGASLLAVVTELELKPDRVAVEVNGEIARRSAWGTLEVHSGDKLEVVHFVGGGSKSGPVNV